MSNIYSNGQIPIVISIWVTSEPTSLFQITLVNQALIDKLRTRLKFSNYSWETIIPIPIRKKKKSGNELDAITLSKDLSQQSEFPFVEMLRIKDGQRNKKLLHTQACNKYSYICICIPIYAQYIKVTHSDIYTCCHCLECDQVYFKNLQQNYPSRNGTNGYKAKQR